MDRPESQILLVPGTLWQDNVFHKYVLDIHQENVQE